MLRNFNIPIKNLSGEAIFESAQDNDGNAERKAALLSNIVLLALQTPLKGDENLTGVERIDFIRLALAINAAEGDVEISTKDAETIKERVRKMPGFNHIVLYRLDEMLEGKGEK